MPNMEAHQFDGFVMAQQIRVQHSMAMAAIKVGQQIAEAQHNVKMAKMRGDHAFSQAEALIALHTVERD